MGRVGTRATGQVLPTDIVGATATRGGSQRVGTHVDRDRAGDETGMNLRDAVLRARALLAHRRVERELDEELAFHIEREMHRHLEAGLSPADARHRAVTRFGSVALAADQCRDARGTTLVDTLARDIIYAFR